MESSAAKNTKKESKTTRVYYVAKPFFREAMTTLAFRSKVNWLEEGFSLPSWSYVKVAETNEPDPDKVYKALKAWRGNKKTKVAGHRSFSIGDVLVIGDNIRVALGRGWALVPPAIWKQVVKQ